MKAPFFVSNQELITLWSAMPTERENILLPGIFGIYYTEKKGNNFKSCSSQNFHTSVYKDCDAQEQRSQNGEANNLCFGRDA